MSIKLFIFLTVFVFSPLTGFACDDREFKCPNVNQCIPKSFHCDGEGDCLDKGDEANCSKPTILETPPKFLNVNIGETFELNCRAVGVPTPIVIWRLNFRHVPNNCNSTRLLDIRRLTYFNGYKVIISTTISFLSQFVHKTVLTILSAV